LTLALSLSPAPKSAELDKPIAAMYATKRRRLIRNLRAGTLSRAGTIHGTDLIGAILPKHFIVSHTKQACKNSGRVCEVCGVATLAGSKAPILGGH
jgi:hypothetical protein